MLDLEYAGMSIPPSWSSLLSSSKPPPRSNSIITRTAIGYRHHSNAVNGLTVEEAEYNSVINKY